jgi:hypothetical protein
MQEEGSERYPVWTGEELPALRKARRERVRELAEHLNLNRSDRAISEWAAAAPRTNRRRVLDQDLVNHLLRVVPPDMLPWLKGWLLERAPAGLLPWLRERLQAENGPGRERGDA